MHNLFQLDGQTVEEETATRPEIRGRIDQGPDAADVAKTEPAQVEMWIAMVWECDAERVRDGVRVRDVDLAGEAKAPWPFRSRHDQMSVRVHGSISR